MTGITMPTMDTMDTMASSLVFRRDHRAIVIFVPKPSARGRHQLNWILVLREQRACLSINRDLGLIVGVEVADSAYSRDRRVRS
jgi:hypothetical protein